MCIGYLGFVLLVWFPGALQAQRAAPGAARPCSQPSLEGGYVVPLQDEYPHETGLTYACDAGRKPVVESWWATSTCQNGKWSPKPQCIDEKSCLPPTIPNGKHAENQKRWFKENHTLPVTCQEGYDLEGESPTCGNGQWSSLPVCQKNISACSEPPIIPNAVIIHQGYREVFADNSKVQYECQGGFTAEGDDTSIVCRNGTWTEGPACSKRTKPGHGGSAVEETTAAGGSQPAGGVGGTTSGGRQPAGGGAGTTGHAGGSSTTSGTNDRPLLTTISHCGAHPTIPNAAVVEVQPMYLRYRCNAFYKQVGSDTVMCYLDGTWSQLPVCEDAFCRMDPAHYTGHNFQLSQVEYIKEGQSMYLACTWPNYWASAKCTNGRITVTRCCANTEISEGLCS